VCSSDLDYQRIGKEYHLGSDKLEWMRNLFDSVSFYNLGHGDIFDWNQWGIAADGSAKIYDFGAEAHVISRINTELEEEAKKIKEEQRLAIERQKQEKKQINPDEKTAPAIPKLMMR
jgi:hypothetical protein